MTNIKATNLELTEAIRAQIENKVEHIFKFIHTDRENVQVHAEIEKTGTRTEKGEVFRAELGINIVGNSFRAEDMDGNLYAALDKVRDQIVRQIKYDKSKKMDFVRRGARRLKKLLRFGRE